MTAKIDAYHEHLITEQIKQRRDQEWNAAFLAWLQEHDPEKTYWDAPRTPDELHEALTKLADSIPITFED